MISALATLSFALVSWALYLSDGHYEPTALQLTVAAALICALALAVTRWPRKLEAAATTALPWLLVGVIGAQLAGLWLRPPGLYLLPRTSLQPLQAGILAAGVITAVYCVAQFLSKLPLVSKLPLKKALFPSLLVIYCALAGWMIHVAPRPFIDVWYFEQRAAELLMHGDNPWAATYPNIYGHTMFFGAQLLENGRIVSHTYPPLSVLMTLPGWLAGDARWSLVASTAGAALLLVAAARRLGLPAGHPAELGAALLLFHSRALFLVEEAWTEPFVAVWAAFCLFALTLPRRWWFWLALAGFLSVKQYGLLWLPALWLGARMKPRDLIFAGAIAGAIALPFFLWDPTALWNGVVAYQFKLQFRPDSLSVPAWILRSGQEPPTQAGFVAAILASSLAVTLSRSPRSHALARAALGGAWVFFAFFLFHKQAFFNYYWWVGVLLSAAVVLSSAPAEPPTPTPPEIA